MPWSDIIAINRLTSLFQNGASSTTFKYLKYHQLCTNRFPLTLLCLGPNIDTAKLQYLQFYDDTDIPIQHIHNLSVESSETIDKLHDAIWP
jgi:hypothetical protein